MRRLASALACALLAAACSSHAAKAHPVTGEEANRLAVMRFTAYRGTGQHVHTVLSTAKGAVTVDGDVDFRAKAGYAEVAQSGAAFTLQWNATTLLAWPGPTALTNPPAKLPAAAPQSRPLAPASSDVDALLALLLTLGQDRPDNAQLIAQDGAVWLRADKVGSTSVDVIAGPGQGEAAGPLYWVDATGHLLRLDAAFGGGASTEIDLDARFTPFPTSTLL